MQPLAIRQKMFIRTICVFMSFVSFIHSNILPDNETQTKALIQRLQVLDSYARHQGDRMKALESTVSRQREEILRLRAILREQEETKETEMTTRLSRGIRAAALQGHVAFSAYLDHVLTHVRINQIIKYDKTVLNDGGAYNTTTGIFTCPVTGVYLFSYMVNTFVRDYQLVVKLVIDGINMSDGTSDPYHNGQEAQGGNTVIMRVNKGQSVWLAAYNTDNTEVDGRETHRFSTLSGVLLYSP